MTMLLAFDTETTGFPRKHLPLGDPAQPHLVQLAALLLDDDGADRGAINFIIQPDGWEIPADVAAIHGITTEIAMTTGVPLAVALAAFNALAARAGLFVAHNIGFDIDICNIAAMRADAPQPLDPLGPERQFCTMAAASPVCRMPPTAKMAAAGFTKFKPPKLSEAYLHFFGEPLIGAHDALVDVRACARIYFALKTIERAAAENAAR